MFGNLAVRCFIGSSTFVTKRFAGHSKWANIKHIKGEKDVERSVLFMKLGQKMKIAIQEGGSSDPSKNQQLSQIIEIARKKNMPTASIQNFLKSAQNDKSSNKVTWYEIRGPRGCYLIVQALTEAPKRLRDNMASILRRNGGQFADNSGRNLFDYKGIVIANAPKFEGDLMEKAVDDAIDCGAEEVVPTDEEAVTGELKFVCGMHDLNALKTKLETKNYDIQSAEVELIPKMRVELADNEMEVMGKLVHKLEELPEIVRLYDNIA